MADKQISQLVAATTINNDDLFVLQQGGTAKKLSGQKLSDFVYQSAADQIERVDEAIEQAQAAVDSLEEQKNEIAQTIASMAELGTDTTLTTPGMAADAAATGEVKGIALARFEQAEITGVPIATFDDGADNVPVKKLVVNIEPVQSGSGDPSPDNVRPITGWTGANVGRTGKNLFDLTVYDGGSYNPNVGSVFNLTVAPANKQFVDNGDGTFSITTSSTWSYYTLVIPIKKFKDVQLHRKIQCTNGAWSYGYLDDNFAVTYKTNSTETVKTANDNMTPGDNAYFFIVLTNRSTASVTITLTEPQIEIGDTFTGYEEYKSATIPITFSEITKNKFDVSQANLTANWTINGDGTDQAYNDRSATKGYTPILPSTEYTLSYTETFTNGVFFYQSNYTFISYLTWSSEPRTFTTPQNAAYVRFSFYSSTLPTNVQLELGSSATSYEPYNGTVYGGTLDVVNGVLTVTDANIESYNGETLPSTWISDRDVYAAETTPTTGAQVVYKLSAPITYALTPTEVKTFLGTNIIWANTGNINDVIYRKMPIPVEELENTLESMIAGVEETMEATQNYAVDKLVIAVHKLYHIDSNIASGETLVPGTNCHVTTVANELIALDDIISQQLSTLGNVSTLTYQVVT